MSAQMQLDQNGRSMPGGIAPGTGTTMPAFQMGTPQTDAITGQTYAPHVVQLAPTTATSGHVIIDANTVATYAASVTGLAPAASATDIFTITGSASKVVRIMRVVISATTTAATAATNDFQFIIRSTANSGGTSSGATAVPYDSADAAASATVLSYTANPASLGTAVGTIFAQKLSPTLTPFTSTDFPSQAAIVMQFGVTDSKPVVLRGTNQVFAINLNAASMSAGASVDIHIEWSESVS